MQNDWEIKGRSRSCTATGREFVEGEFFYTLLYRDAAGFRREDLSEDAWRDRNNNVQPYSFWRTKYELPPPPPPEPLKKNDAESLLRALIDANDPRYRNAIYILALMLERKRALRAVESPDDDTLIYEKPSTGETFILSNPRLTFEQIPAVQLEVAALLDESLGAKSQPANGAGATPEVEAARQAEQ